MAPLKSRALYLLREAYAHGFAADPVAYVVTHMGEDCRALIEAVHDAHFKIAGAN